MPKQKKKTLVPTSKMEVISTLKISTLYSTDTQQQTAFENIVVKEEIACNEQFLLFPQCFLLNKKTVYPLVNFYDIISLFDAELEEPKLACEVKG